MRWQVALCVVSPAGSTSAYDFVKRIYRGCSCGNVQSSCHASERRGSVVEKVGTWECLRVWERVGSVGNGVGGRKMLSTLMACV